MSIGVNSDEAMRRFLQGEAEPLFRDERGEWPERPVEGPSVSYTWTGHDPSPDTVSSGAGGMLQGWDFRVVVGDPPERPSFWRRLLRP